MDLRLVVELAWQTGRDHVPNGLAEMLDDARHARIEPPRRRYEQRVRDRLREMEAYALASATTWRGQYPGGPVDWETGRVLTTAGRS